MTAAPRRPLLLSLLLIGSGILVLASPVAADAAARTSVDVQSYPKGFFGQVKSPKTACAEGSSVVLVKRKGSANGRGHDVKVARVRTKLHGGRYQWAVATRKSGRFYAHLAERAGCEGAASEVERDMPRGAEIPPCPSDGFCRFDKIHLDIPGGTYCPPFGQSKSECTGGVTSGLIPWCCNESDRIVWSTAPNGSKSVLIDSHFYRGDRSLRWTLDGTLPGSGSADLSKASTKIYARNPQWSGSTPDLPGQPAGSVGGPLYFDFQNGTYGADIYVHGYFQKW